MQPMQPMNRPRSIGPGVARGLRTLTALALLLIALPVAVSACASLPPSSSSAGEAGTYVDGGGPEAAEGATGDTATTVDRAARDAFLDEFFSEDDYSDEEGWGDGEDEEIILVTYQVSGDDISGPVEEPVSGDLADLQGDVQTQEEIWDYFVSFMPADQRDLIAEFIIFTDGSGNVLAATDQLSEAPDAWSLEVDIADAEDKAELTYTLLHEYAHVLTLNNTQFSAAASGGDTYESEDEPLAGDSYLNLFYQEFWTDIYTEWELAYDEDYLDDFYEEHSDEFLTDYAATEPEEDIAESWLYFIIEEQPQGESIAEDKMLFFYDFPAMTALREEIRDNLYLYLVGQ
jgi:hypothetical protein